MILACQNITKSYAENVVLKNINFHIEKNDKCGIVGINGAGKTTLLRVILGEEEADSGNVVVSRDVRMGYLSQTQDTELDNTIYGAMQEAKKYILEMEERLRQLEKEMEGKNEQELAPILEAYNRLSTAYDRENGYAYESEIAGVIAGLGFTEADYDRPIESLSGGQKMRVALGRLLLSHPDIIILDEPTNHLDMKSISWLESFLASYPGAVIVVSHDRYFIDKVTNKIIEIDQGVSEIYNGSYSYYSQEKAKRRQAKLNAYYKQQAEIQHEQAVITKLKQFNREKSIKRAESREKKLEKIPTVGDWFADLPATISLIRSYIRKEYSDVPIASIIAALAAALYVVSPVDLVPDFIPGVGMLDDAAVLVLCWKMIHDDVDKYQEWRKQAGKEI